MVSSAALQEVSSSLYQIESLRKMSPFGTTLAALAVVAVTPASAFVAQPSAVQLRPHTACSSSCTSSTSVGVSGCSSALRPRPRRTLATELRASSDDTTVTKYELDGNAIRGPLTPVEDTIVVKVDIPEEMTSGGLYLPTTKKDNPTRGTVTAVGEGKRHWDTGVQIPIKVSVGERVVYGNFDGTSVQYQGSEHLLMRDNELLMAYEGDEISLDKSRMVGDRVLLRVKAVPKGSTTSAKGILIAESATRSNRPTVGIVEKVGPGRMVPSGKIMPMYVEPGDKVKFKVRLSEISSEIGVPAVSSVQTSATKGAEC